MIRNIYLFFVSISGMELLKETLGIFCDEDNNGVFCFINEVTLGKYPNNLRMGLVGTFSPTPRSPGREEGQGA